MMQRKTLLFISIILILSLSLVACDGGTSDEIKNCTVTFDSDGGTPIESQTVISGERVTKPSDPTKDGYSFVGWYLGNSAWNFEKSTVKSDMTLIAIWQEGETQKTNENTDTVLKIATHLIGNDYKISFGDEIGDGVLLLDGVFYKSGDLKPVWSYISSTLDVKLCDADDDFDIIIAPTDELAKISDSLLPIGAYISNPENKFYRYITLEQDTRTSVSTVIIMNESLIREILDGENDFSNTSGDLTATSPYFYYTSPYITPEKFSVQTIENGNTVSRFCNLMASGSIIRTMNVLMNILTPSETVNTLREYIDKAYGNQYGSCRSELFLGERACWNADELVALLRAIKANAEYLSLDNFYGIVVENEQQLSELSMLLFGNVDTERIEAMKSEGLIHIGEGEGVMYFGDPHEIHNGYSVTLPPIIKTQSGAYTRYADIQSESKSYGIAVSADMASRTAKTLEAVTSVVEFLISDECKSLLKYGTPSMQTDEKYNFFGEEIPTLSEAAASTIRNSELEYADYAEKYFGLAFSIYSPDGFEYQCMTESEKSNYEIIRTILLLCDKR